MAATATNKDGLTYQFYPEFIEKMNFPRLKRFHTWFEDEEILRENLDELVRRIEATGVCPNIESIAMSSETRRLEYNFDRGVITEVPAEDLFEVEWREWHLGMALSSSLTYTSH